MDNYEDKDLMLEESLDKIMELLVDKQYFRARDELLKYNEADIAELLEEIIDDSGIQMAVILFRLLPKNISVEVFSYLPSNDQVDIINEITDKEITYIIQELDFDDKIDVLEELPANIVDKILEKAPKNERKQINTFLNYPENSAGSLMTPEYISLMKDWTVREALEHIKKEGIDAETIYTCYVKDTGRKLIGIVSLSTLVVTDDAVKIKDIMVTDYVYEDVDDDQEEVSEDFKKYGYLALPVVDSEHRLVGIITFDDILDVMEDEATEDIERMNGVIDFDDSDRGYLDTPVWQHALNRLPWLIILMVAYIFTGRIVTNFETSLSKVIELVAFMPMLMGTGGNTGSQAATLIIRGLATDEVDTDDALRVLWKEMRVGVIIGVILSVLNYLRIYFIDGI
ncbi:magnesium transporter, partial [Hornefia butyriciproducens]